ncbi:MAG: hypothetical protein KBT11_10130 [Treponema sp.]|nr:hypothetical protein [Candidatus Treponema equifaecale]
MAEQEVNTINHLLEVEQNAQAMIQSAQIDADKKISVAKAQADSEFKAQFEKIVAENEKSFEEKSAAATAAGEAQIKEYKEKISSANLDFSAFNQLLDKILA